MRLRVHQLHHQRVCLAFFFFIFFLLFNFYFVLVLWDLIARLLNLNCVRASDKCQREKRKTINGDDLLWAMATLGFEDYIDPLKIYLTRYREVIYILRFFIFFTFNFTSFSGPLAIVLVFWKIMSSIGSSDNVVYGMMFLVFFAVQLCFSLMVIFFFVLLCPGPIGNVADGGNFKSLFHCLNILCRFAIVLFWLHFCEVFFFLCTHLCYGFSICGVPGWYQGFC